MKSVVNHIHMSVRI